MDVYREVLSPEGNAEASGQSASKGSETTAGVA
jgi:hypothetical protein